MCAQNLPKEIAIPGRKGLQTIVIAIGVPPAILALGAFGSGSILGAFICGSIAVGIWTIAGKIKTTKKLCGGIYT